MTLSETLKEQGQPGAAAAGGMTFLQARNQVLKPRLRRMEVQQKEASWSTGPAPWPWCSGWPASSAMSGSAGRRASQR